MTAARYVTIWCDGKLPSGSDCGEYVEGDRASDARLTAARTGAGRWMVNLLGGRDLCPRHVDQRDAATRWGVPS